MVAVGFALEAEGQGENYLEAEFQVLVGFLESEIAEVVFP